MKKKDVSGKEVQDNKNNKLVEQLREIPKEAFERLQYLQPQVGCFNNCSFCSQEAGKDIWQMTSGGLSSLFNAMAKVAKEKNVKVAQKRENHRPGVVFPYLDNDIGTYPYINDYFQLASELLNVRVRVSTLGFSSAGDQPSVHQRLVETQKDVFDGIRFSFTPYAPAYLKNKERYIEDVAQSLKIYKPLIDHIGLGASTAAVELRFPPMLFASKQPIFDQVIDGYHVISIGPHMLISKDRNIELEVSKITDIKDGKPKLSTQAQSYRKITSDKIQVSPLEYAKKLISNHEIEVSKSEDVDLYLWENTDGPYYAINPFPTNKGKRNGLQIYQKTDKRPRAGYIDSSRPFLEALIDYKEGMGLDRKDQFPDATWEDVDNVLNSMREKAISLSGIDKRFSEHINKWIVSLVSDYAKTIKMAGFEPHMFFDSNWTIDTGPIVNQGRAKTLFRGLTSTEDEPMSINEERGYGETSLSSERGTVWRLAPIPSRVFSPSQKNISKGAAGKKNDVVDSYKIVIEELDPQHLRPYSKETGKRLRRYVIDGVEIEHKNRYTTKKMNNYPGYKNG